MVERQQHHPHGHKGRQSDELSHGAEAECPGGEGGSHQPCLGAAAAGEHQLHRLAGRDVQCIQLSRALEAGEAFRGQRYRCVGDAEGEGRDVFPHRESKVPLAGVFLPPAVQRDALGGVFRRQHAAAVQALELRVAPDTGQHDEGREQGGENQNGPFLLHGDASPCRCAKNKVYYSITNRAKKGEG